MITTDLDKVMYGWTDKVIYRKALLPTIHYNVWMKYNIPDVVTT